MPDKYLTIPEVAEALGVKARSTVYRHIADGSFTLVDIGRNGKRKTRIPQSQLDAFIAERTREPAA
jgi:excisionase family DNA binding protein